MYTIDDVKKLTDLLIKYSDSYYLDNNSLVSDKEYDELVDKLSIMEQETNFSMSHSPVQKVQGRVMDGFVKVKHSKPMLSAEKTKNINEIKKFIGNNNFYCSYKCDGLTLVVRFKNGKFLQAITRGNGEYGEDVTEQAKMILNLPMEIPYKEELEIRGECVISWDNFKKINETLVEPYSHPRNLASGSIRQLNTNIVKSRNLSFIVFECVTDIGNNDKFNILKWLNNIGFTVVNCYRGKVEDCIEKMQPKNYEYPVDGLIFELNDRIYSKNLPSTGHHEGCRMALKWKDDTYDSKLQYIDWTMGRTGLLTPTAVFDTIEIDGTDVCRASVHNLTIIKKLGLTNHCSIHVYKANMIIPQIDSCESDGDEELSIPTVCPSCGESLIIKKDNKSEVLMCINKECPAKKLSKFTHFVSKPAMNIDGLSQSTLEKFIGEGFIKSYRDIYHLDKYKDQIIKMDGFGVKSYDKLIKAIENSRNVRLENYLVALGIDNIGKTASKTISRYFHGNYEEFIIACKDNFDFTALNDFGKVMNDSIYKWFNTELTENSLENYIQDEMYFIEEEKDAIQNKFINGKIFCVTGKFNTMPRGKIESIITERGGKLTGSVSKKTDYLLTNEADSGSSKAVKAKELGTPIMTEDEFLSKI